MLQRQGQIVHGTPPDGNEVDGLGHGWVFVATMGKSTAFRWFGETTVQSGWLDPQPVAKFLPGP
ncbi:hypothetical protein GCM10027578_14980 [Spirosoma luteolum]